MAHVLIGFAEALPAPEVVFSLLAAGHDVSAFGRSTKMPLAHLLPGELHAVTAPEQDAAACTADVRSLMAAGNVDWLLPLDDTGLWIGANLEMDSRIAGATGAQAAVALDKSAQIAAAKTAGLHVPATWNGLGDTPSDLTWPAIAKPAFAVRLAEGRLAKEEARYFETASDAAAFFATRSAGSDPYLVQPLIAGQGEGVFGIANTDGVQCWSGHRRLRMMNPHGSGSSACQSFSPEPALQKSIANFVSEIDWTGPFMVELLRDAQGTPWFMELNGRMWGSMALARRQGLEYPAWAVAMAEGKYTLPTLPTTRKDPLVVRHIGREILHLIFTLRGPKSAFHRDGWPPIWRSAGAVLRPGPRKGFYNYDPAHPWYFLRDALWTVKKALLR